MQQMPLLERGLGVLRDEVDPPVEMQQVLVKSSELFALLGGEAGEGVPERIRHLEHSARRP